MKIIEKISKLKGAEVITLCIAFAMPVFPKILPGLLVLLFLSLLLNIKRIYFHKEYKVMTWLFSLTYLFYVFGLLSSNHIADGLFILQVKLSFFLLPLFFLFHGSFHILTLRRIFFAFVFGCFVNSLFSFKQGYDCYCETNLWECFYSSLFAFKFHTTYLAIYFCFSILILIYYLINYFSRLKIINFILIIFLILYFSAFVVMLSSKGGLIALATVMLVSILYFFYKRGNYRNALIIFSAVGVLMFALFFSSDYAKVRLKESFKTYQLSKSELFELYKETTESTAVRLMIWDVTSEIIKKNPLGVGTGDAKYILKEEYKKAGMNGALNANLNCHNQFYETTLAIGIHGLIVLLIFLGYLIYMALRKRNFLLLWLVVMIVINLFFESMFETQAGVIFFVFFTLLLLTSVPDIIPINDDDQQ